MNRRITKARRGLTLIEVIFAVVLSAAVAIISVSYLQTPGTTAKRRACDLRREVMQDHLDRYVDTFGRQPSRDLRELRVAEYAGLTLPVCPAHRRAYLNQRGVVECPDHRQ